MTNLSEEGRRITGYTLHRTWGGTTEIHRFDNLRQAENEADNMQGCVTIWRDYSDGDTDCVFDSNDERQES